MNLGIESETLEFKKSTGEIEKAVDNIASMLNKHGHEIDITPTQVEIYNPGEFPQDLTPVMFAEDRIKSMPRNKVILNAL